MENYFLDILQFVQNWMVDNSEFITLLKGIIPKINIVVNRADSSKKKKSAKKRKRGNSTSSR